MHVAPETLAEACLRRIDERDGAINAFIHVCRGDARRQARQADAEIALGHYRGPLRGVRLAIEHAVSPTVERPR